MTLEEFKNTLMNVIYQHLRSVSQEENFSILCNLPDNPPALLKLTATEWQLIKAPDPSEENSPDLRPLKDVYDALFKTIISAKQGFELWQDIKEQTNAMPGWWQFFAPLRPLNVALNGVLNEYSSTTLKLEDDDVFKEKIKELLQQVKKLAEEIKQLVQRCNFLEEQLRAKDTSHKESLEEQKNQYNQVIKEKEFFEKKYVALQRSLNQEIDHYKTKFDNCEAFIITLQEALNHLEQDNLKLENSLAATTHELNELKEAVIPPFAQGNIQEGNSQEIMQRHNQNYRGTPLSRNGRASQIGLYRHAANNTDEATPQSPYQARQPR